MTLDDLYDSGKRVVGKAARDAGKKVNPIRVEPLSSASIRLDKITPFRGTKSTLFQFVHRATTKGGAGAYRADLMFLRLEMTNDPQDKDTHLDVEDDGEVLWIEKPDVKKTEVKVFCTCPDYRFTFSLWNFQKGAQFGGRPAPYKRKTKTRPEVNPQHRTGMCKHLINSVLRMQTSDMTRAKLD